MTHTFYDNTYQPDMIASTSVARMMSNFNAVRELFAGTAAPPNVVAGQLWFDTDNYLVKIRDQANANWLGAMMGLATSKIAIYNASTGDGWVDGTGALGDKILAIKGGSVYTTGGADSGTWTISDMDTDSGTGSHSHQIFRYIASQLSKFYDSSGNEVLATALANVSTTADGFVIGPGSHSSRYSTKTDLYTDDQIHSHTVVSDAAWRPAAAVVTLQYLDM